jgi:hypothetical protein
MELSILSLSRRHVLGSLYDRCDTIQGSIPIYLSGDESDLLGYADESLGHYADAFSFHLKADLCKKLSMGQFSYSIGYEHSEPQGKAARGRVKLTSINLVMHEGLEKPVKPTKTESTVPAD